MNEKKTNYYKIAVIAAVAAAACVIVSIPFFRYAGSSKDPSPSYSETDSFSLEPTAGSCAGTADPVASGPPDTGVTADNGAREETGTPADSTSEVAPSGSSIPGASLAEGTDPGPEGTSGADSGIGTEQLTPEVTTSETVPEDTPSGTDAAGTSAAPTVPPETETSVPETLPPETVAENTSGAAPQTAPPVTSVGTRPLPGPEVTLPEIRNGDDLRDVLMAPNGDEVPGTWYCRGELIRFVADIPELEFQQTYRWWHFNSDYRVLEFGTYVKVTPTRVTFRADDPLPVYDYGTLSLFTESADDTSTTGG